MTPLLFNMVVNTAFSFLAGLLVVSAALRLLRVNDDHWKLFFLSLPFVKVWWDLLRGLPSGSLLYTSLNPLAVAPKANSLHVSMGLSEFGPQLGVEFSTRNLLGTSYQTSLADYLYFHLLKIPVGLSLPAVVLGTLAGISVLLVLRRMVALCRFESRRRQDRRHSQTLDTIGLRYRSVDVYVSRSFCGSPFTGGLWKPYICLAGVQDFSAAELRAVVAHEVAHVVRFDMLTSFAISVMGDVLWFLPGYRRLQKRIDRLREILADQTALRRSGTDPIALASALLKVRGPAGGIELNACYSAFSREPSLIAIRVTKLLNPETSGLTVSRVWKLRWLRPLLAFWIFGTVMMATVAGNGLERGHRPEAAKSLINVE